MSIIQHRVVVIIKIRFPILVIHGILAQVGLKYRRVLQLVGRIATSLILGPLGEPARGDIEYIVIVFRV